MIRYSITDSEAASMALEAIAARLWPLNQQEESPSQQTITIREPMLQLVSMKECFDLELLTRFYNELMIPNFPLEEERDDLDDWVYCLDPVKNLAKQKAQPQPYPSMDVVLLVKQDPEASLPVVDNRTPSSRKTVILAGVAFEYYKQAQCGLLSYMVVPAEFRRLGIMRSLHPVACCAMELLHREHISSLVPKDAIGTPSRTIPTIKAIFAETNTPEAGDVPPTVIRKRHETLYKLGYRHLKFPYVQPALAEGTKSFDEIILLIHAPNDGRHTAIQTEILHDYVVDFFQSVTGYDNDLYKEDWYYKLVEWFRRENSYTDVAQSLPWDDITQAMKEKMANSTTGIPSETLPNVQFGTDSSSARKDESEECISGIKSETSARAKRNHVVVIGAGIAGLVSTVTLAEEYLKNSKDRNQDSSEYIDQSMNEVPLTITLIEAQPFVGGRIRTVVTKEDAGSKANQATKSHPLMFTNHRLSDSEKVDSFLPWPVAIGAEFVHGVDSMANHLILDHEEWQVLETFDLCETPEEYPSRNSFVQRRSSFSLSEEQRRASHVQIFMDGKCHPLQEPGNGFGTTPITSKMDTNTVQQLVRRANHTWQNLQYISESVHSRNGVDQGIKHGQDMSLEEFIEDQLSDEADHLACEEVEKIKQILESIYSNTAGTCNKFLGIHEASREEFNWEYTESNFRLEQCFNEFIKYYLDRIAQINEKSSSPNHGVKINIEISCPVSEIGSSSNPQDKDEKAPQSPIKIITRAGRVFVCDKCIVTVPLGVLKAKKLIFNDAYQIPRKMQEAIDTINMFSGMKAHMLLKVGRDIHSISNGMQIAELLFCPGEIFSQIWLRRNKETVFLTGFCVANCRMKLMEIVTSPGNEGKSKSKIARDLMLDQVQRMFESPSDDKKPIFVEPSSPTCSSFAIHDWSEDEFTLGIYSSPSVGAGWGAKSDDTSQVGYDLPLTHRDYLVMPINNEVWLSGEHANTKTCATVQSAMESGTRAAKEVYRVLQSEWTGNIPPKSNVP